MSRAAAKEKEKRVAVLRFYEGGVL